MTTEEKVSLVEEIAREKNMTARAWKRNEDETRVYLRRTNAARTEAGYIKLYMDNGKARSALVCDGSGTGSRTAASEAQSVYSEYRNRRAQAKGAQQASVTPPDKDNHQNL